MKIDKFLKLVDVILDALKSEHTKNTFSQNMEKLGIYEDKSLAEWWEIYMAWNELADAEDIERHWDLDNV